MNPEVFADYALSVLVALGGLTIIGVVVRRFLLGPLPRRGLGAGDTDPGSREAVAQLQGDVDALRDEVSGLRRELDEAQNRIDFTERLLAQARSQKKLPAGAPRGAGEEAGGGA